MSKCYLLGAGASYDYADNLTEEQRLPLTNEFFSKGLRLGIFNKEHFPKLIKYLDLYLKELNQPSDEYRCDVEDYLSWLCLKLTDNHHVNFVSRPGADVQTIGNLVISSNNQDVKDALSECYYYIYELIRRLCLAYTPKFDNYRRLALHYFDDYYTVVTLNYDLLFEMACESVGLAYSYTEAQPTELRHVKLVKLHGSVNWVNQMYGGTVIIKQPPSELYKQVISNLYNVRYNMKNIRVLSGQEMRTMTYRDIAVCGYDCYEPVIIPPLHEYKDYEKVKQYEELWQSAKRELKLADEVVIIGCALRLEDKRIHELLKDTFEGKKRVTICSPDFETIKSRIPNISNMEIIPFSSFTAYAKTL